MDKEFINEHIDDSNHSEKIEKDLNKATKDQEQFKRLVDVFVVTLVLIFAIYSIF